MTIRSMHAIGSNATATAKLKTRALAGTFFTSLAWRVASQYAPGILWDWHIFLWFFQWSGYSNAAIDIDNWGWVIEWTPAFIGTGLLVGLNPAISFFGGSVLSWGMYFRFHEEMIVKWVILILWYLYFRYYWSCTCSRWNLPWCPNRRVQGRPKVVKSHELLLVQTRRPKEPPFTEILASLARCATHDCHVLYRARGTV